MAKDYSLVAVERGAPAPSRESPITSVYLPDYFYGTQSAQPMMEALDNPPLTHQDLSIPYSFEIRHSVRPLST